MIYVDATESVKPEMREAFKQGATACIAATATSITIAACIVAGIAIAAMVTATVGMTTIEHPCVD